MTRLLDILITAEFNGTLTSHRSERCVVGEVIFHAIGMKIAPETWMPILDANRMAIQSPIGLRDIEKIIVNGLRTINVTIDDLLRLDEVRNHTSLDSVVESTIEMVANWNQMEKLYV